MRRRIAVLSSAVALILAPALAFTTIGGIPAASVASEPEPAPQLTMWAPDKVIGYSFGRTAYVDFNIRLEGGGNSIEIWSKLAAWDQPITSELRVVDPSTREVLSTTPLPAGTLGKFSGFQNFLKLTIRDRHGDVVLAPRRDVCLNGTSERARPDAEPRSPYPMACPRDGFVKGSVQGIQAGWSTNIAEWYSPTLAPGGYDVTAVVAQRYVTALGLDPATTTQDFRLRIVDEGGDGRRRPNASDPEVPQPEAAPPTGPEGEERAPAGPRPDLQSLPAFGIDLNEKRTQIRFAATVWNAGNSPVVVDGFRASDDEMTTYQYFFDTEGNQTGYEEVGTMHWHDAPSHLHWHFLDFATYSLVSADDQKVVKSKKQSFCLANTDAVDYTVDGADWHPEGTDLDSACGGFEARSVRQTLSAGSGDTYVQYRAGQSFNIKDVPNGTYYILVKANPAGRLVESDTTNNVELRKIKIGGPPMKRWVKTEPVGVIDEGDSGGY